MEPEVIRCWNFGYIKDYFSGDNPPQVSTEGKRLTLKNHCLMNIIVLPVHFVGSQASRMINSTGQNQIVQEAHRIKIL